MIKSDKICINRALPRVKELSMKNIWPEFANDKEFCSYFPDSDDVRPPPRLYFFQLLLALRPNAYKALIKESKSARMKALEQDNRVVQVEPALWETLQKAKMHENLVSATESKRIVISKIKKT